MEQERPHAASEDDDGDTNPEDVVHGDCVRSVRYKNGQDAGSVCAFGPSKLASLQHVDNLSAIIEEGIRQKQLSRVAGASSLLIPHLAMDTGKRKYRPSETQRTMRQLHALEAGLECLQHPPQPVTGQHLMRLLRQVQALQVMPGQRVSMQLEQAFALMLAGNLSDAYDTLAVVLTGAADDGNRFTAQAFCGLIRHAQWASAMQAAAAQMQPKPSPGRAKVDAAASVIMEWFAHDPALVAKAGRGASEFWKDAERHLKAALAIQPAASDLGYTLVQMYCALGKQAQALEAASQLSKLAPHDADAHALHLLMLEAQSITDHEQASHAGEACCQLLKCDPGAHSAAQLLIRLAAMDPVPPAALADALMLHLDVCSASYTFEGSHHVWPRRSGVWSAQAAKASQDPAQTQAQRSASDLDNTTDSKPVTTEGANTCAAATWAALAGLLTRCAQQALRASDNNQGQANDGSTAQTDEDRQEPTEDSCRQAASASGDWAALQPVLRARAWWWGAHMLKPACIDALASAGAHETLAAMALVAAFVDISDAGEICQRAVTALKAAHAEQAFQQLQEGLELCQSLAEHRAKRGISQEPYPSADPAGRKRRRRDTPPADD